MQEQLREAGSDAGFEIVQVLKEQSRHALLREAGSDAGFEIQQFQLVHHGPEGGYEKPAATPVLKLVRRNRVRIAHPSYEKPAAMPVLKKNSMTLMASASRGWDTGPRGMGGGCFLARG